MNRKAKLAELKAAQKTVDALRAELRVSAPGENIFESEVGCDRVIIVIADGFGGADMSYGRETGPDEMLHERSRHFKSENRACELAGRLMDFDQGEPDNQDKGLDWDGLLDKVFGKE